MIFDRGINIIAEDGIFTVSHNVHIWSIYVMVL